METEESKKDWKKEFGFEDLAKDQEELEKHQKD